MAKRALIHLLQQAAGIGVAAVGAALVSGAYMRVPWGQAYAYSLGYTALLWTGNVMLMAQARKRLPGVENTGKRVAFMFVAGTAFTIGAAVGLDTLLHALLGTPSHPHHIEASVRTSLTMTYLVCAILEAQYYFKLWKEANQQAAALQQTNLQSQIHRLKAELNPHFLFNNFNTLASVIEEDPAKATRMVHALSKYYRYVLQASQQTLCTLADELASLEAYTYLLKIRHEAAFQVRVQVAEPCRQLWVPPLTLQLLAENAVKHNSATTAHPLMLEVACDAAGHLTVRNNRTPRLGTAPGAGIGLANLQERFRLLGLGDIRFGTGPDGWFTVDLPLQAPAAEALPLPNPTHTPSHADTFT